MLQRCIGSSVAGCGCSRRSLAPARQQQPALQRPTAPVRSRSALPKPSRRIYVRSLCTCCSSYHHAKLADKPVLLYLSPVNRQLRQLFSRELTRSVFCSNRIRLLLVCSVAVCRCSAAVCGFILFNSCSLQGTTVSHLTSSLQHPAGGL